MRKMKTTSQLRKSGGLQVENNKNQFLQLIDRILAKYQDHIVFLFLVGFVMGFLTGVVISYWLLYIVIDKVMQWIAVIRGVK